MDGKEITIFVAEHYDEIEKLKDKEFTKKDTNLLDTLIIANLVKSVGIEDYFDKSKPKRYVLINNLRNIMNM